MNERIKIDLGARSYDIHVGPGMLAEAGTLIAPFARGPLPVVTDANVAFLHLDRFLGVLEHAGLEPKPITVDAGESTKSFFWLEKLIGELIATGVDRGGLVVAFGGGVIGDLTGFAAGILKRGISFAQVPTTLLSQVDSSVGGKTGINIPEGKNLVGVFHQPKVVIADTDVLGTLPRRELLAGYAEVLKIGAVRDADYFAWLEQNATRALHGEHDAIVHTVAHACRMKAHIVERDEQERGERALLNLGHTFGHALETATGFSDRLLHGEGVAIGTVLAFRLSVKLGLCSPQDAARVEAHVKTIGLPAAISDIAGERPSPDVLLAAMAHDKKVKDGKLNFVLARGIGQGFVTDAVPVDAVRDVVS
ncbi:3-dehydroquinate synthase [Rhizomicrobium electricum]|uniref:3-dehydroquinate synthase n=1 Tax=Rhizomicrobium electricum TaxID=480070 RepID=A0ABP3PXV8_9PROT|nr:3-dehydroquinate synthase [Rhizomicrobium electricum]NIJ50101.1 3-dehydroquinate synthase [Rhizomicrobium electricum]